MAIDTEPETSGAQIPNSQAQLPKHGPLGHVGMDGVPR